MQRSSSGDRSQAGAYDAVADREWDAVIDVTRQPGFARGAAAALAEHAAHWTFISSGNVYAAQDEPGADESAELMPPLESDESTPDTYGEAKSAIELAYREALGDRLLVVRPGLIAGPGDASGRSGYWVARAARDDEPMLVPDILDAAVQAIHVDDLVRFTLDAIEQGRTGAFNAVGDRVSFEDWLEASRAAAGARGRGRGRVARVARRAGRRGVVGPRLAAALDHRPHVERLPGSFERGRESGGAAAAAARPAARRDPRVGAEHGARPRARRRALRPRRSASCSQRCAADLLAGLRG